MAAKLSAQQLRLLNHLVDESLTMEDISNAKMMGTYETLDRLGLVLYDPDTRAILPTFDGAQALIQADKARTTT